MLLAAPSRRSFAIDDAEASASCAPTRHRERARRLFLLQFVFPRRISHPVYTGRRSESDLKKIAPGFFRHTRCTRRKARQPKDRRSVASNLVTARGSAFRKRVSKGSSFRLARGKRSRCNERVSIISHDKCAPSDKRGGRRSPRRASLSLSDPVLSDREGGNSVKAVSVTFSRRQRRKERKSV